MKKVEDPAVLLRPTMIASAGWRYSFEKKSGWKDMRAILDSWMDSGFLVSQIMGSGAGGLEGALACIFLVAFHPQVPMSRIEKELTSSSVLKETKLTDKIRRLRGVRRPLTAPVKMVSD